MLHKCMYSDAPAAEALLSLWLIIKHRYFSKFHLHGTLPFKKLSKRMFICIFMQMSRYSITKVSFTKYCKQFLSSSRFLTETETSLLLIASREEEKVSTVGVRRQYIEPAPRGIFDVREEADIYLGRHPGILGSWHPGILNLFKQV